MPEPPCKRQRFCALAASLLRLPGELERPGAVAERAHGGIVIAEHAGECTVPIGNVEGQRVAHVPLDGRALAPRLLWKRKRPQTTGKSCGVSPIREQSCRARV